jgi:cyclopropane fatty-acyl-phospholipid synthase-like methyltransferase
VNLSEDELQQVASALDASPRLVPFLPELLADLWDLGSSPRLVSGWLGALGLPTGSTSVLDLGCGKGAVSLTLARDLDFRARGVDLFEPFVREARGRAAEWGLSGQCRFETGDLRVVARSTTGHDVVVYASVGVLGPLDECVATLRQCVREGGFMVVDEGVLAPGAAGENPFPDLADLEESRRRLTAHGDRILRERVLTAEEMKVVDRRYIASIRARAEALAAHRPADAELVLGYVERQRRAAAAWERHALGAAWLLHRG